MNIPGNSSKPIVILTGPTRGLGRALFAQLVSESYSIVGLGRNLQRIQDLAATAAAPLELVEVDLGDDAALATTLTTLCQIILVSKNCPLVFISNAAAIEPIGQARSLSLNGLEHCLRINCVAPILIANTLAEITYKQTRPLLIIDISSGAARRPVRGWQGYCTSKAALNMALDVLAAENSHVQVTHFDPGIMDTPMQQVIREQREEDMPEVVVFRAYQEDCLLKSPSSVATEIILEMRQQLQ